MSKNLNLYKWVMMVMLLLCGTLVHAQTADLTTHQPATLPSGYTFEWHTGPTSGSALVSNPAAVSPGVYYAFYKDASGCYSQPSSIRVIANTCPATTIDLAVTADASQAPSGTVLSFHTGIPVSNANKLSSTIVSSGGTYYAAYYNATSGCYSNASPIIVLQSSNTAPLLTVSSAVCNGANYTVSFSSNGTVTASAGTISGNTVTVPTGTNLVLTATSASGCATTIASILSPNNCANPPTGCTTPTISAGQGVCQGTGTYSVAFAATAGATVTASAGTVSGNTVTGIAIGTNVTLTATVAGGCNASVTVNSPADCTTSCATAGVSVSAAICNGATYSVNIVNPNGAVITVSAGTLSATAVTNIPVGTNLVLTATASGCTPQTITITSPSKAAPLLTVSSAVCNGANYTVSFSSNGIVTASAGTISGNTVTVPTGTNLVLTATSVNGCATTIASVVSPTNCTNPPTGCTTPTISAGQGVCQGTGTYSVAFAATAGATVTASAGTVSGNTVTGIAIGTNVTLTATVAGGCNASVTVNSPADCTTSCATAGVSVSAAICNGATYSVNIVNPNNAVITVSAGTLSATAVTGIPVGTNLVLTATASGCTPQTITITSPSKAAPLLTVSSAVCNGANYTVSFSSNGIVTASAGTISGNTVTVPTGTNLVLTATSVNGCATTIASVASPTNCTNPPTGCTTPTISAGQGVCQGTGTYSVAFAATAGATVTASAGTVSGNTVTGIAIGTNVTLTATVAGGCSSSVTVNSPADCTTSCATAGVSVSAAICNGTTYSVNIVNPNGATVTASAGTVTATAITGIAIGTNVTITATASGCTPQTITITSPSKAAPLLTVSSAVCNGTNYTVNFSSNGTVTASAGTISGNTVTVPTGTNLVLTATSVNGCATTIASVASPTNCTNPPTGCTTPTISAGQGVCQGTGTYSVAFAATAGATVTASAGTVSGNTVTGIAIGTNVTLTATVAGGCNASVTVNSPADCTTSCATAGVSVSAAICNGATYSVNIVNPNGAVITVSAGTLSATAVTNIPVGTNLVLTATASGCTPQTITIASPTSCTTSIFTPDVNVGLINKPVPGNVSTNDIVPSGTTYGDPGTPTGGPTDANPTITMKNDGTYTFTTDKPGVYTYLVPVCVPGQAAPCPKVPLVITVTDPASAINPPIANLDLATTKVNTAVNIRVKDNDGPGNAGGVLGLPKNITGVDNGAMATANNDGTINYTPARDFVGNDTLTYQICETPSGLCATANVIITINAAGATNTTVAVDDYATTPNNTAVSGNVKTNDSDPQGDAQTVTAQSITIAAGKFVLNNDGSYTFTPASGFAGTVDLPYNTCDNGTPQACAMATLHVVVQPQAPIKLVPDVNVGLVNLLIPGNVSTNDVVPAGTQYGDPGTPTGGPSDAHPQIGMGPDGKYTFTTDKPGVYTYLVPVCVPGQAAPCPKIPLVITVTDPTIGTNPPVANLDLATTKVNTPVTVRVKDNDGPGNPGGVLGLPTNITGVNTGARADVNADGTITYTPAQDFVGNDTLTYQVCETPSGLCATASVIITVTPAGAVNTTVAVDDYVVTPYGSIAKGNVSTNDSDPQGDKQTVTPQNIITAGGRFILNTDGSYTFTPTSGFVGTVDLPYNTCDNGTPQACAMATLHVTVLPFSAPDLTPAIRLGDNSFITNTSKDFVVEIDEINNVATASGIAAIRITVPVGYQLSTYNSTQSVATPAGLAAVTVNNSNWQVVGTPTATSISLRMVPGANIKAGGFSLIGLTVTRIEKAGASSGNITVSIFGDATKTYDSNSLNNSYSRIVAGL
ncbi:MAG: tandem-95 repeat protein [Chitinophagaceae bacterium]